MGVRDVLRDTALAASISREGVPQACSGASVTDYGPLPRLWSIFYKWPEAFACPGACGRGRRGWGWGGGALPNSVSCCLKLSVWNLTKWDFFEEKLHLLPGWSPVSCEASSPDWAAGRSQNIFSIFLSFFFLPKVLPLSRKGCKNTPAYQPM